MKKLILLFTGLGISINMFAQAPSAFQYQAVARDDQGVVMANQKVQLRIGILKGSFNGAPVYTEIHHDTTNKYGLINLAIGNGESTDDFSAIDWSSGPYFIKVELDEDGGTDFRLMGTSQLLSVPYAKYADKAGNVNLNVSDTSVTNELQLLSISDDTIFLDRGGYVVLPDSFSYARKAHSAHISNKSKQAQSLVMKGNDGRPYMLKIDSSGNLYTELHQSYKKLCGTYEEDLQNHNSCNDSKECLIGTWQFQAFIDTANCIVEYVPDSINGIPLDDTRESKYQTPWLTFFENDSLVGYTVRNKISKYPLSTSDEMFVITNQNELEFSNFEITAVGEPDFGIRYYQFLLHNNHTFQSFNDTLFLYNAQSKMFFKKK